MSAESEAIEAGVKAAAPVVDDVAKFAFPLFSKAGNLAKRLGKGIFSLSKNKAGQILPLKTGLKWAIPAAGVGLLTKSILGGGAGEGTSDIVFPTAGAASAAGIESDPYYQALAKIAGGYGAGGGGGGGADMSAAYGNMANMANQAGGASMAAMQRLAQQATGAATGVRAGGEASAAALQRIYGDAANQILDASRQAGATGSSLTPVSGMMAALPEQIRRAGGTESDYLKANQLIQAQDLGYLADLAKLQGTGYGTQFARQDAVFRMADQARRAAAARAAAAGNRDAAMQAMLKMAQLKSDYLRANPAPSPTLDIGSLVDTWNNASATQKAYWKSQGINNAQQYIDAAARASAAQAAKLG